MFVCIIDHGLLFFNSYRPRLSLTEVLLLSSMFSQALFIFLLSFEFYKAANLFEILIWYCFLTSSSLSFPRLNLSTSNFCAAWLFTANLSLISATTTLWSVSQSAPLKYRTLNILKCHLLSINMWSIRLWVFRWEHGALIDQIVWCA